MQVEVFGGVCLLAFLLSLGRADELDGLKEKADLKEEDLNEINDVKDTRKSDTSNDLKSGLNSLTIESNSQEDGGERSAAMAQSSLNNFGGSSVSNAIAYSHGAGSSSAYSDSGVFGGSSQSKASAYGSSLSAAESQAISESGSSSGQGRNSYPYSSSYPYSGGLSSAQAHADNGFYQPVSIVTPILNQGLSYDQSQVKNGFYQPEANFNPYGPSSIQAPADNGLSQPGYISSPNFSPYNKGSSIAQAQAQVDSESYQPNYMFPKTVQRLNPGQDSYTFSSSYPYSQGSSAAQAQAQANTGPYQPIPIPNPNYSPYERFLVPYDPAQVQVENDLYQPLSNYEASNLARGLSSPHPKSINLNPANSNRYPYQPIPIPDPNPSPYDSYMVPYKEPSSYHTKEDSGKYLPISIVEPNYIEYGSTPRPYNLPSNATSISQIYGLRMQSSQAQSLSMKNEAYQPIPIPDPNPSLYDSLMVPYREPNSVKVKTQTESDAHPPNPITYDRKAYPVSSDFSNIIRAGEYDPALDDVDLKSKTGWDSNEYNPNLPSDPYLQLYPSGADPAEQANADGKPGDNDVNRYIQRVRPYVHDYHYPSESPYRPDSFYKAATDPRRQPDIFASGQSSLISFEDAKSRLILPHEYVFPNKMPGGENAVQCLKENEFHHFWSPAIDCLVCICLNEYGLLTPVCARCSGCHNPPPKLPEPYPWLPESVTTRPPSPEPFEPLLVIPEYPPVPQPAPYAPEPLPEPYPPNPSPEPYPVYTDPSALPNPVPSPLPVPFPEPLATLPPVPPEATCNPLPSGQPFPNPLHPCQVCVCRESYVSGKPDVQIQCKESPQCITPADVTSLPPLPDVPGPIPLPICEKFPEHVLFPHPTDTCRLCKCASSLSEAGIPEQQITCYPHPDCVPKVEPVTELEDIPPPLPSFPIELYQPKPVAEPVPIPAEPLREPFVPMDPVPLPELVTVEPLPWPPITTIAPIPIMPVPTPRPGPLPGPSPHESCRPYPPNQAFQHPWDECQICLCTEAFAVGMVTVEVNCYTKPICCIEPPDSVKLAIPGKLYFRGYSQTYPVISNTVNSPDIPVLPSGPAGVVFTSTYKPPSIYSSYSPRSLNVYPGNQGAGADALTPPQYPPPPYPRLQSDDTFANPQSSYSYQPNYHSGYVNQQYPDFPPPRLPVSATPVGQFKPSNYGYPGSYQYGQDNSIGNTYPAPQGVYQPYDQRYQGVQAPNVYPPRYQRPNYEMPSMYPPGQVRDSYAQAQASAQGGANSLGTAQAYVRSKSANDGSDDSIDESR